MPDVSLEESQEDTDVADDGHDEGEDVHGVEPVRDSHLVVSKQRRE